MLGRFDGRRVGTHLALAGITAIGCVIAGLLKPGIPLAQMITLGTGYVGLALLAATLLIGPWSLGRRRRNPVNINLRRDTGVWAGIAGCLHVWFGFQVHMSGNIVAFFVHEGHRGFQPLTNTFGLSNYAGAAATAILVLLLLLSNNITLRRLKGPLWKAFQRTNYLLFFLVVLHTFGYQAVTHRAAPLSFLTMILVLLVLGGQSMGAFLYTRRAAGHI